MRGSAVPTGGITPSITASNPDAEKRLPYDMNRAKQEMDRAQEKWDALRRKHNVRLASISA